MTCPNDTKCPQVTEALKKADEQIDALKLNLPVQERDDISIHWLRELRKELTTIQHADPKVYMATKSFGVRAWVAQFERKLAYVRDKGTVGPGFKSCNRRSILI